MRKNNPLKNQGFIAFIAALIVSVALMAVALSTSSVVSDLFDQVTLKKYRTLATQSARVCFDQVLVELEHDYFYTVENTTVEYPAWRCSVVSVTSIGTNEINKPTNLRKVVVVGYSGVSSSSPRSVAATVSAQIIVDAQNISLVSETTKF